jgi:hypothetical protein
MQPAIKVGAAQTKLHAIHDSASELSHRCFGLHLAWRDVI